MSTTIPAACNSICAPLINALTNCGSTDVNCVCSAALNDGGNNCLSCLNTNGAGSGTFATDLAPVLNDCATTTPSPSAPINTPPPSITPTYTPNVVTTPPTPNSTPTLTSINAQPSSSSVNIPTACDSTCNNLINALNVCNQNDDVCICNAVVNNGGSSCSNCLTSNGAGSGAFATDLNIVLNDCLSASTATSTATFISSNTIIINTNKPTSTPTVTAIPQTQPTAKTTSASIATVTVHSGGERMMSIGGGGGGGGGMGMSLFCLMVVLLMMVRRGV